MRAFVVAPSIFLLALGACGPATSVAPKPNTAIATPPPKLPAPESPARWSLHPTHGSSLRAKLELASGGTLYVGDGGERWLDKKDGSAPIASSILLPEPLAAAAHAADGKSILVVGKSGTIYTANDPLGAITGTKAPPQKLRSIAAGKSAILGIGDSGALVRTIDAGNSWAKVDLPSGFGTLVELAMNDQGAGVALFAPQRALVTTDDGATFQATPTPGVGARGVLLDVNGDLVINGLEASAVLKLSPTRFEKVARAARSEGFDLAGSSDKSPLAYALAIGSGKGAFVGARYVEAVAEPDDATRWRVAIGPIGATLEAKKVVELNGCTSVFVGGDPTPGGAIYVACDGQGKKSKPSSMGSGPSGYVPPDVAQLHLYRTDDEGKTWRDDGVVGSEHSESGHVWVAPDKSLIVEGGCKKSKSGCGEGPPVIRVSSAKTFAKVGVPKTVTRIQMLAFAPGGAKAYSLARGYSGPLGLLVSTNAGKDFTRTPLPSIASADGKGEGLSATRVEPTSVSVDDAGVIYATAHVADEWALYTSDDDGQTIKVKLLPFKADAVAMVGKHGFAYERHGKGWESADGGATWSDVGAPPLGAGTLQSEQLLACGLYGCFIGDRATRVGWGGGAAPSSDPTTGTVGKPSYATPLKCALEGTWTALGAVLDAPTAYEADAGNGARWMAIKHDPLKGSVSVVLGKAGKDAKSPIETRDVSLFGPGGKDTATAVLPQVEGVAAIRYAFKRDKPAKGSTTSAITAGQKVDVDVAWYLAATGKVHKATIHGAGPLDAHDVITGGKDSASHANIGLLSIAIGGVHVRPFAGRPEDPLYFVHDNGKVDRLSWPEMPTKDGSGALLSLRPDAVRVGNRSVVIGVSGPGLQLYSAWGNESGTAWESRTWGVWPELLGPKHEEVLWDFTYIAQRPAIVAQWGGGEGIPAIAWAVPLKGSDPDPTEAIEVPTQRALADPPKGCNDAALATPRIVAPPLRGTRHPIVITGEGNEVILATTSAVMHGSGKDACVTTFEAGGSSGGTMYDALIPPDDLAHAVLFRASPGSQDITARSMSCSFAPGPLPKELSTVEGFD